jgi:hypothetical protein
VSNVQVTGRFDIEDVHRWDLIENRATGVAMNYRGTLDFGSQRLELMADNAANPNARSAFKLVVDDLMYHPNWSAEVTLNRVPAAAVVEAARHMGAPIPADVRVDGDALGVIAYGSIPGMQGQIAFENAVLHFNQGLEFRLPSASVLISGDELRLLPATLSVAQGRSAQLQATYAPFRERIQARLTGRGLAIEELQSGPGHLLNGAAVPVVDRFQGGTWSGTLSYVADRGVPGVWTADLHVADTTTILPGFESPFRINAADVSVIGRRVTVRRLYGNIGEAQVLGEYRYVPGADRPHRFALSIPSVEAAEFESTLTPTLRRDSNFLYRTFRLRNAAPEWLRTRRAEGTLRIGKLTSGDLVFRGIRSRVIWDGPTVELSSVVARLEGALIRGSVTADLSRGEPVYNMRGTIDRLEWRGGRLDIEGSMETRGMGVGLLANLRAVGHYAARSVVISPELALKAVSGTFDLAGSRSGPQMKLTVTDALLGQERFSGQGVTQADGRLQMDLASGTQVMRLRGPVLPLQLELAPERMVQPDRIAP